MLTTSQFFCGNDTKFLLTHCCSEVIFDLQNVLLLVFQLLSFHLPSCSHTPAFFHPSSPLSLPAALGMPWGDGSLAPQLCGCRTGAVTFKPSISTLSLPDLSALTTQYKEKKQSSKERGRWERLSGPRVRWTEWEMATWWRKWIDGGDSIDRRWKERWRRGDKVLLSSDMPVKKSPADSSVCLWMWGHFVGPVSF